MDFGTSVLHHSLIFIPRIMKIVKALNRLSAGSIILSVVVGVAPQVRADFFNNILDNSTRKLERGIDRGIDSAINGSSKTKRPPSSSSSDSASDSSSDSSHEIHIADISENVITLNRGGETGLKTGMEMSVERITKRVRDPNNGKLLRLVTEAVGRIQITQSQPVIL
jgi:hypothetical protein